MARFLTRGPKTTFERAFKASLFEKIEDELDAEVAQEAFCEYVASGEKRRDIAELWRECDL